MSFKKQPSVRASLQITPGSQELFDVSKQDDTITTFMKQLTGAQRATKINAVNAMVLLRTLFPLF